MYHTVGCLDLRHITHYTERVSPITVEVSLEYFLWEKALSYYISENKALTRCIDNRRNVFFYGKNTQRYDILAEADKIPRLRRFVLQNAVSVVNHMMIFGYDLCE